uniref:Uncharacterized protein n=1 Tax=Rhizophora mucronata TaxID=61149 RepID=A0A2P2P1J0_RHIMU
MDDRLNQQSFLSFSFFLFI